MRYKVYDEEDKKERTLEECVTPLEVGSVRRVQVKKGDTREVHHFRVGGVKECLILTEKIYRLEIR